MSNNKILDIESPSVYYQKRKSEFQSILRNYKFRRNLLTGAKIIFFLGALFLIYLFASRVMQLYLWASILSLIAFIVLNVIETGLLNKILLAKTSLHNLEIEEAYLSGDYKELDPGKEYMDQKHPYSHDLDIFGEESMFQSINRAVTPHGRNKIANWLQYPLKNHKDIISRQEAIEELSKLPDWCHNFRAIGNSKNLNELAVDKVTTWQDSNITLPRYWRILIYILPVFAVTGWILCIAGVLNFQTPLYYSLFLIAIVLGFSKKIGTVHAQLDKFIRSFSKLYELIVLITKKEFTSAKFCSYREILCNKEYDASRAFSSLKRTLESFDQRGNLLAAILLNGLFMKDLHLIVQLAKWKKVYGDQISVWIDVAGEVDALVSFANYRFNHPAYIFPTISKKSLIHGEAIGHPLLSESSCVTNDFSVESLHEFYIVTGANMAGKSTFLRSIGVNLVLAQCGSVVSAQNFSFQPMALFSSMRTADNLAKGTSYFHAELIRLKQLIEMVESEDKTFIILDEILKGTNSVDKLNGSIRFLQKLRTLPISGLIATHDLELGKLADRWPENYINKCFEITHTDDDIAYDYKLKPGISQNMNASILLEKMGLV